MLIVDDSATLRDLIRGVLADEERIDVVGQAGTGGQAISLVEQLRPDIVTMDVEMPDMNGLEATRRIMATHPTPILIVTGHRDVSDQNVIFEAMKAGAVDVMAKPENTRHAQEEWKAELVGKIHALSAAGKKVRSAGRDKGS